MSASAASVNLCGNQPTAVPKNTMIPEIAKLYALGLFRADFRMRIPAGETFSEWDLFRESTGKTSIDRVLKQISTDFRNYYSKSQRNRLLIKSGTPASGLREGRSVRADGLGIGLDPVQRAIVCELMEVTTVDEAEATIREDIQPKLALLRGPIKTLVDAQLREQRLISSGPERLVAYGTPWVVPPDLAIIPIFPEPGTSIASVKYRWLCFAPTYQYRPMPPLNIAEPEESPARGLIVYSYHEYTQGSPVPVEVFVRFQKWIAEQARAQTRLELLPTNAYTDYWARNPDDLRTVIGFVSLGITSVAVIALAIFLAPALIAGAAATLASLSAAAASVDAVIAASSSIVALISSSLPQLMRTAQTALNAAVAVSP